MSQMSRSRSDRPESAVVREILEWARLEPGLTLHRNVVSSRAAHLGCATGLGKGSPDLIGWLSVPVKSGKISVFVGIEVKRETGGVVADEQSDWIGRIRRAGGIAGVAHSVDNARKIITDGRLDIRRVIGA